MFSAPVLSFGAQSPAVRLAAMNRTMNEQFRLPGLGDRIELQKQFSRENLQAFCDAVGDLNIQHLQGLAGNLGAGEAEPKITIPGAFVTAQITRAFITMFKQIAQRPIFPIYGGQKVKYLSPVHVGDTVRTDLSVRDVDYKQSSNAPGQANVIYTVDTTISQFDPATCAIGKKVVEGEATIIIRLPHDPQLAALVSRIRQAQRPEVKVSAA